MQIQIPLYCFEFQSVFKLPKPYTIKIDIIIAYLQRYEFGHEKDFVPPITPIHLAALTPAKEKEGTEYTKPSVVNI